MQTSRFYDEAEAEESWPEMGARTVPGSGHRIPSLSEAIRACNAYEHPPSDQPSLSNRAEPNPVYAPVSTA